METNIMLVAIAYFGIAIIVIVLILIAEKVQKKKLGKITDSVSLGMFKQKSFKITFSIIMIITIFYFVYNYLTYPKIVLPNTLFQLMILLIIFYSSYVSSFFHFGSNGLLIPYFKWSDITKYEWDNDIKQEAFGLKIYSVGKRLPHKIYVPRKLKDSIDKKLRTNFKKKR